MYLDVGYWNTVIGDSVVEFERAINMPNPINISRISCSFINAGDQAGTIRIGTAASGGGDGLTITLASTYDRGAVTGNLTLAASSSLWFRFTNCDGLGAGGFMFDYHPTVSALPGISSDDLLTMITEHKDIEAMKAAKLLNIWVREARRWIMNSADLPGMQETVTYALTANDEDYAFSAIATDIKYIESIYIDPDTDTRYHVEQLFSKDEYNRAKVLTGENVEDNYPQIWTQWDSTLFISPVRSTATINIDYWKYLADVSGSSSDYLYTNCAYALRSRVHYCCLRDMGKIDDALKYKSVSEQELKKVFKENTNIRYSGNGILGLKMRG